jgi:hypothetical protein
LIEERQNLVDDFTEGANTMIILDPNPRPGQAGGDAAKPKLMALIAFGGVCENLDVDAAAAKLRQAGYEVFRLPDKYRERLFHPLDDFIEAHIEGPDDPEVIDDVLNAMEREVSAIVDKYGGDCAEWGLVEPDHIPFADVFTGPD